MFSILAKSAGILVALLVVSAQAARAQKGLSSEYKKWVDEDVRWIITDQERRNFFKLATDDQRDQFVVKFWESRNPKPGSKENTFKEEHYLRLAFANEHFATELLGWRSDRGRIYILLGPPDLIERGTAPWGEFLRETPTPYEVWRYKSIQGSSEEITIDFVDECLCGKYRQTTWPPVLYHRFGPFERSDH